MKVTFTVEDSQLEITGANDFRIVLGAGTSLTLEIKDTVFNIKELKEEPKKPARKKPQLSIVKVDSEKAKETLISGFD
jgi:hypothetical protein